MIYTPRSCVDMLLHESRRGTLINPTVCTKIEYLGYEISISMDSSIGPGDLCRSDIRIFRGEEDLTRDLFPDEHMLYGTGAELRRVFARLDAEAGLG